MHMSLLQSMFTLELSVVEKILRPILVYVFLIVGLRLAGKRELAQLNPFDLVVLLTISNTVQNAIIGRDDSVTGGLIGAATLLGVNHVAVRLVYAHKRVQQIVEGTPTVLMEGGTVVTARLEDELVTPAELESSALKQGFTSLDEIERAVLEPGGSITFFHKRPTPEEARDEAIMQRLDRISAQLAALRA
jgi:uncharacterized membrane protein YcaP (DUF421 family)